MKQQWEIFGQGREWVRELRPFNCLSAKALRWEATTALRIGVFAEKQEELLVYFQWKSLPFLEILFSSSSSAPDTTSQHVAPAVWPPGHVASLGMAFQLFHSSVDLSSGCGKVHLLVSPFSSKCKEAELPSHNFQCSVASSHTAVGQNDVLERDSSSCFP